MSLLDLIHKHRAGGREVSEEREESLPAGRVNSLYSHSSLTPAAPRTETERCTEWLLRYVRGRYPKLADVKAAAAGAGFSAETLETALSSADLVTYKSFPRRNAPETERVRTVDDWPDDPPMRCR
jgi:hypothetical protein